ncbi:hypothetical protein [Kribbella sp. CA-294648]|uniref:hypothetical protein n=1 Tax=Kribbella sp. CA-294648 TaxID=3239948 RepID=UPI003D8C28D1
MDHQDDDRSRPAGGEQAQFSSIIAIAEGILIERYVISAELARALLEHRSAAAGLPVVEAANWLLCTQDLP